MGEQLSASEKRATWRSNLAKKATYKALEIPLEDGIGVSVVNGLGWKEIAAIGAISLGFLFGLRSLDTQPATVAPVSDSEYEVRFYDADGNRLPIDHRPPR